MVILASREHHNTMQPLFCNWVNRILRILKLNVVNFDIIKQEKNSRNGNTSNVCFYIIKDDASLIHHLFLFFSTPRNG